MLVAALHSAKDLPQGIELNVWNVIMDRCFDEVVEAALMTTCITVGPLKQVVSMCLAGAAIGSISGAGLAEKFGRKGTLVLDTIPLLLGAVVMATATSLNGLIAGRVLAGIGIGLASAIVPLYISEVLCFATELCAALCALCAFV